MARENRGICLETLFVRLNISIAKGPSFDLDIHSCKRWTISEFFSSALAMTKSKTADLSIGLQSVSLSQGLELMAL